MVVLQLLKANVADADTVASITRILHQVITNNPDTAVPLVTSRQYLTVLTEATRRHPGSETIAVCCLEILSTVSALDPEVRARPWLVYALCLWP